MLRFSDRDLLPMKNGDVHYVQNGDVDGDDERNNIDDISISSATCGRTMNLRIIFNFH